MRRGAQGAIQKGITVQFQTNFTNSFQISFPLFMQQNIMVIEGLVLSGVDDGLYTLTCLPLKIANAEGAPARCILTDAPEEEEEDGLEDWGYDDAYSANTDFD